MIELALNKIQKYYGATKVLEDITFEIGTDDRVGIVGSNGCGKSTLLKIIMGIENYEKGTIAIRKGAVLGYLEQMPVYKDSFTVLNVLNTAFEKVDAVYEEMEQLQLQLSDPHNENIDRLLEKYSKLQATYEGLGGYEKEEKLSKICNGLKIDQLFTQKLFCQLSGGEKTTVILGKILLQNPDILLLDEPSNHLDLEAMEWLENYLKEYKGVVVAVSHDRYFLDNIATKIIEIEDMLCKSYYGNYSAYVKEKEKQLELQMEEYQDQQKKIKAIEKAIAQLKDWGARGNNEKFFKRAASMQKMLDKIKRVDKPIMERDSIRIKTNAADRSGNDVVKINELCKSYGEKILLNEAELMIKNKERVALIGSNGCGKSTMIKILLGLEQQDSGKAELGSAIKLGYLPQNISFKDESKTVLECFREDIIITEGKAREYLAKYMFFGEMVFKKVESLSGGERSRLVLAILLHSQVNLLILDEPTNHLDIDSREELEEFLKEFEGTLLFVSHDRYFINNIAKRVVELCNGKFASYKGNYEYYKEKSKQLKAEMLAVKSHNEIKVSNKIKNERTPNIVVNKVHNTKMMVEDQIEMLEKQLKNIENEIQKYNEEYQKLGELYNQKLELQLKIDKLIEEYVLMV